MRLLGHTALALLAAALCSLPLLAQSRSTAPLRRAESSVQLVRQGRRLVPRIENVRFTVGGHGPWQLYEEHFVTQENDGNCCFTQLSVTAFEVSRTGRQRQRWELRTGGDTAQLFGPFYEIFEGGCCGGSDSYRYYDAATGKMAYESIQRLLSARVYYTDHLDRYVAILNDRSPRQNLVEGTSSMSYGSESRVLQKLLFRFPHHTLLGAKLYGPDNETGAEISLNRLRLPASSKLLSGFSIELDFRGEHDDDILVLLPVEDDVVRFERAKLAEGLTIEAVAAVAGGVAKTNRGK